MTIKKSLSLATVQCACRPWQLGMDWTITIPHLSMVARTEIHIVNGLWLEFRIFTFKSTSIISWSEMGKDHKRLRMIQFYIMQTNTWREVLEKLHVVNSVEVCTKSHTCILLAEKTWRKQDNLSLSLPITFTPGSQYIPPLWFEFSSGTRLCSGAHLSLLSHSSHHLGKLNPTYLLTLCSPPVHVDSLPLLFPGPLSPPNAPKTSLDNFFF